MRSSKTVLLAVDMIISERDVDSKTSQVSTTNLNKLLKV